MGEIIEKDLSYLIMQAAYEAHNNLGPGFPEKIYEEAMVRELMARKIEVQRQKKVVVNYKGEPLGEFALDLLANQRIILELKAVSEILRVHEQQALSYLKATELLLAIVINFGAESVQSSRVVNTKGKAALPRKPQIRHILK
ncbi:MAG: GxxExxY protein [Chloroflexi bacterium]|nr:GxxExxY protein [Chloroflexota bacterium]